MTPSGACGRAALLALALSAPLGGSELRFEPQGNLVRRFTERSRFELAALTELASGEELPAEQLEFSCRIDRELELVDAFGELVDGRPQHVARRFETATKALEIELALEGFEELYDGEFASPVEGESVRLEWDEDEGAHIARSEDGLDPLHLERLREDCDLRALLPPEGIAEGGRWTISGERLRDLLAPGGALLFTAEELPDGPYGALTPVDLVATSFLTTADAARELDGEARLVWIESEGAQAVIELELELELSGSMDEELAWLADQLGAGGKSDVALDYAWSLEGRGQLVWELEAGHFQGLELRLEGALQLEMQWAGANGPEAREGMRVELETTTELRAECRPE